MASSKRRIRYAVVGLGNIAQVAVLPAFAHAKENSELVALISSDEKKLKELREKYGVHVAGSYDALETLIRGAQADAVYLATPNAQHHELTKRAMEAGAHVLCEKPMGADSAQCRVMNAAAKRTGKKLMIAYRLHFDEGTVRAFELIRSGKLGEVHSFSSDFSHDVYQGDVRTKKSTGGGALFDLGPYPLNMVRHLFGAEPREVFAFQEPGGKGNRSVDDRTTAVLRFEDGRTAMFHVNQAAARVSQYRVVGTKGDLRVEPAFEYAGPQSHFVTVGEKMEKTHFPTRDQFAAELIHFSDCILNDRQPLPSGEDGARDVAIFEAMVRSFRTGRVVKLPKRTPPRAFSKRFVQKKPKVGKVKTVRAPSPSK